MFLEDSRMRHGGFGFS